MFEDNLGKYMLPYKIVIKTFGKSNQLSSKDMPKEDGISYGTYRIQINKNKPVMEYNKVKALIIEKKNAGIIKLDKNRGKYPSPTLLSTINLLFIFKDGIQYNAFEVISSICSEYFCIAAVIIRK